MCDSLCESSWTLGARGVCSNRTNRCVCPDGYTGVDRWGKFESCHVNKELKFVVNFTTLAWLSITLAISSFWLLRIMLSWAMLRIGDHDDLPILSTTTSYMGRLSQSMRRRRSKESLLTSREKRLMYMTKRRSLLLGFAVCFWMYPLANLINQVGQLQTPERGRYDDNWTFDLFLAWSHNVFVMGLWGISYTLYDTLPKFTRLAKMNGLNSIFIRHPKLMYYLAVGHIVVICVSNTMLCLILPTALGSSSRPTLDLVFLVTLVVLAIEYEVVLISVCNILAKLYMSSIKALEGSFGDFDIDALEKGLHNVRLVRNICPIFALFHSIPFVLQISAGGQLYSYIFCGVTITAQTTFCLVMVWLCYSEYQTVRDKNRSIKGGFLVRSPVMSSSMTLFQRKSDGLSNRISL